VPVVTCLAAVLAKHGNRERVEGTLAAHHELFDLLLPAVYVEKAPALQDRLGACDYSASDFGFYPKGPIEVDARLRTFDIAADAAPSPTVDLVAGDRGNVCFAQLIEGLSYRLVGSYVVRGGRHDCSGWDVDARNGPILLEGKVLLRCIEGGKLMQVPDGVEVDKADTNTDEMAGVYDSDAIEVYKFGLSTSLPVREMPRTPIAEDGTVFVRQDIQPGSLFAVTGFLSTGATLVESGLGCQVRMGCISRRGPFRACFHGGMWNFNVLGLVFSSTSYSHVDFTGVSDAYAWDCLYLSD